MTQENLRSCEAAQSNSSFMSGKLFKTGDVFLKMFSLVELFFIPNVHNIILVAVKI